MKIITIIGARPQFIKAATVSRLILKSKKITELILHTGQHYDANMSEVFFEELAIPKPHYNLGIGGGSHGKQTGEMLSKIEAVLLKEKPDNVLVYGDTNSTLAGALAASKLHVPVIHVEAGLRSYNKRMPEEQNRILTDHLASILFAPTTTAVENLTKEGIARETVINVGDVMYDAAIYYGSSQKNKSTILKKLGIINSNYILSTIHRAENTDNLDRLKNIIIALNEISNETKIILPIHPRTKILIANNKEIVISPNIMVIEPVGYFDMVMLEKYSSLILTDSGGIQKEAYFHGKPCLTLRDETEWNELIEHKVNILVGASTNKILGGVDYYKKNIHNLDFDKPLYGSGNSAQQIVNKILTLE